MCQYFCSSAAKSISGLAPFLNPSSTLIDGHLATVLIPVTLLARINQNNQAVHVSTQLVTTSARDILYKTLGLLSYSHRV